MSELYDGFGDALLEGVKYFLLVLGGLAVGARINRWLKRRSLSRAVRGE